MRGGMRFHNGRWYKTKCATRTPPSVPEMKLISLNINGVHQSQKRNDFLAMQMQHMKWGVALLSDIRVYDLDKEVHFLNTAWKCKQGFWSKGTPNAGGTAILFYKSVDVKFCHHDAGGRYSRVDFLWEGELFTLVCIYAPANHTDRNSFFADKLFPYLQKHPPSDKCFIGGDFNFVESPTLDRSRVLASCIAGLIECQVRNCRKPQPV
jgi:exonuclease III